MDQTMQSPFTNDPFAIVYKAFRNLYPDKKCRICWEPEEIEDNDGKKYVGFTHFAPGEIPIVAVSVSIPVKDAVETLAHELAHVAAGDKEAHGEEWENAFDAIHAEYDRIGDELFGADTRVAVTVSDGKGGYDPDLESEETGG